MYLSYCPYNYDLTLPTCANGYSYLKICGDLRGHYAQLLQIFDNWGYPSDQSYLFLGKYVDRGCRSLETICLLLAYKIKYPERVFMLRGSHESASLNRIYGFYDECKRRYSIALWKVFNDCFNYLPFAAIVDRKIFAVHSGLSPDLQSLSQIRDIKRPTDVSWQASPSFSRFPFKILRSKLGPSLIPK